MDELHSFTNENTFCCNPSIGVTRASDGAVYGGSSSYTETGFKSTLYRLAPETFEFRAVYQFGQSPTDRPGSFLAFPPLQASDRHLYGILRGNNDSVVRFLADGRAYEVLHRFPPDIGAPQNEWLGSGPLVEGQSGALYGFAFPGTGVDRAVFYTLSAGTRTYAELQQFMVSDIGNIREGLMAASDGAVYALAVNYQDPLLMRRILRFQEGAPSYTEIARFSPPSGGNSVDSRLVEGRDGFLYGVTGTAETATSAGTLSLFRVAKEGGVVERFPPFTPRPEYSPTPFPIGLGVGPEDSLVGMVNGYGSTMIFRVSLQDGTFRSMRSFSHTGWEPFGAVDGSTQASDGQYYGVMRSGGRFGHGAVFRLRAGDGGFEVLTDRFLPEPAGTVTLVEGADGVLYGASTAGGWFDGGTAFRMERDGSNLRVLHSFGSNHSGFATNSVPSGALAAGRNRTLVGVTDKVLGSDYFGSFGAGTIFRISEQGTDFQILHTFIPDGPAISVTGLQGPLLEGSDGVWYGVVRGADPVQGYDMSKGFVFRLDPDGEGYKVLHTFALIPEDGQYPHGALLEIGGKLVGVTEKGGHEGRGTLFTLGLDGSGYQVLRSFGKENNGSPIWIMHGSDGGIYATSSRGETDGGTIFRVNSDGTDLRVLTNFRSLFDAGWWPRGPLIERADGNLYGTTMRGAQPYQYGHLFRIAPAGGPPTMLVPQPREPSAPLLGSDGAFYFTGAAVNITGADFRPPSVHRIRADNIAPHVGTDLFVVTNMTQPLLISVSDLLKNDTDRDDDTLRVVRLDSQSLRHASVNMQSDAILYMPTSDFMGPDRFQYTITDDNGGTASGQVWVCVNPLPEAGRLVAWERGENVGLVYVGVAGASYTIETSVDLTTWVAFRTGIVPESGLVETADRRKARGYFRMIIR